MLQLIDFYRFEETFRIDHHQTKSADAEDGGADRETPKSERRMSRRVETVSLLENNRMRNVGQFISRFANIVSIVIIIVIVSVDDCNCCVTTRCKFVMQVVLYNLKR